MWLNENDKYVAQWLRNLIVVGHLPEGEVNERDIRDIRPDELTSEQCHFFAGIGGWPYALELAGWEGPVWTGSCPCQPFSQAGRRRGTADERHLWPAWFHLISQCRPDVVFGEQVASADGIKWLEAVHSDLENMGYAVGAAVLSAAGVGAPHQRHRIFFVAESNLSIQGMEARQTGSVGKARDNDKTRLGLRSGSADGRLADRDSSRCTHTEGSTRQTEQARGKEFEPGMPEQFSRLGHSEQLSPRRDTGTGIEAQGRTSVRAECDYAGASSWADCEWVCCRDPGGPKLRPVEPGTFPLAHGVPCRVGRLRAYGNAIVPQVAAEFVRAYMQIKSPEG